jgi:hypothetical protein
MVCCGNAKKLCIKDEKCNFCFYDKYFLMNYLRISCCFSPYINYFISDFELYEKKQKCSDFFEKNVCLFACLWVIPSFLFLFCSLGLFLSLIIFFCPMLFILILNLPAFNPTPAYYSIFDIFESSKGTLIPDPNIVNFYFSNKRIIMKMF